VSANPEHPNELFDLSGKVAVVTGGSRGLGREMVLAFAKAGAAVVIASRKAEACDHVAGEVRELGDVEALAYPCHMGDWDAVGGLADAVHHQFGRCDILVNNAGMSPLYPSLGEISEALWDKVLDVNLKGPFRLSALIGERMVEAGSGSIINVSSVAGSRPTPVEVPYGVAKAGIENLTYSLSKAFAPNVRVNCIAAGPFLTDISKAWDMEAFEKTARAGIALQRGGRPDEVVGTALYLASEASSYLTGAVIPLDGNAR
jgi:NAD(P)-dependent dehydrogenase (short-subunit alcohol dehydrogenase family)